MKVWREWEIGGLLATRELWRRLCGPEVLSRKLIKIRWHIYNSYMYGTTDGIRHMIVCSVSLVRAEHRI